MRLLMQVTVQKLTENIRENATPLLLGVVAVLSTSVLLSFSFPSHNQLVGDVPSYNNFSVPKLSEISGSSIDAYAAAVQAVAVCQDLSPVAIWMFLLVAYIALLIFNLSFTFAKATKIQWVWESILTLLFLAGWLAWDDCQNNLWFPLSILQFGVVLYALYLYFFERKK